MFSWFRKKSKPAPMPRKAAEGGSPVIAALLLDTEQFDIAAAQAAVVAQPIEGIGAENLTVSKGILAFTLGDEMMLVSPMQAPYPWTDLEGPCHTSWMWPKDKPAMSLKEHKSHVLVVGMKGMGTPIARRIMVTRLLARLARLPGVVGVMWPEGAVVHFPPVFADLSKIASVEQPPLMLWVDYRVIKESSGAFTCFTNGLGALGLMEMEIVGLSMAPGALREWAMNITQYMLDRGAPIPDGDTIGATADERLRISHGPSRFGLPGTVMRFGK